MLELKELKNKARKMVRKKEARKNKKAQEEIVGFVLIMVLIVVIGLIFFALALRQKPEELESKTVANFLQTTLDYTTKCAIIAEPQYSSIRDLIKSCYDNEDEECRNLNIQACTYLEQVLTEILNASIKLDGKIKSYKLTAEAGENIFLAIGALKNCTKSIGASQPIATSMEDIIVKLTFCY